MRGVYDSLKKAGSRKQFLQVLDKLKGALRTNPAIADPNYLGSFPRI
jgi:hypothetical protein